MLTSSATVLLSAESKQVGGECFCHLAGHRADDPNGDIASDASGSRAIPWLRRPGGLRIAALRGYADGFNV
jgi:hypothetical protein